MLLPKNITVQKSHALSDKLYGFRQVRGISAVRTDGGISGKGAAFHKEIHIFLHNGKDMLI